ncbi:maleylpyruvate isomerase N-terminal domain-containing protein [Actinoplanes sp. NPDC049548]|uniref:maleylpyruvate isomerase N-terminal domain-containing protein n=1 Tax=Actinoplanes sp. NPDC049548 TaxID=3155152 RepID=UPI0034203BF6
MLDAIDDATAKLLDTVRRLTDDDVRRPSLLPGWTRGHVLTHIARGGEALRRVLHGEPAYPSQEARDAEIEAGSQRPVPELLADIAASADAFRAAVAALPADGWDETVTVANYEPFPKSQLPVRRLHELEVHHVDLGLGYAPTAWSAYYLNLDLPEPLRTQRAERLVGEGRAG